MLFYRQEDMSRLSHKEIQSLRRKVGIVFQDYKLTPWKTVRENIALPLSIIGMPITLKNQTLDNIIKVVGLTGYDDVKVSKLSG